MKTAKTFLFALIIFQISSFAVVLAGGDEPELRAFADRKFALIGDRVKFTVVAKTDKNTEVLFSDIKDSKIGEFEIKDSEIRTKIFFGKKTITKLYYVAAYTTGKQLIPPVEIKYRHKAAKDWSAKKANSVAITINSVLPKGAVIRDIRPIKGPLHFFNINWVLVALFLLVLAAAVVIINILKKKTVAKKTPYEIAINGIEAAKKFLTQSGNVKEYYAIISDAVRRYIEAVFSLRAPEMTTEEFLNSIQSSAGLTAEHQDLLKDFLIACDLVKFAKYAPKADEIESVHLKAKKFIDQTHVHI